MEGEECTASQEALTPSMAHGAGNAAIPWLARALTSLNSSSLMAYDDARNVGANLA